MTALDVRPVSIDALRVVHNSVYSAAAYERELDAIFRRVWTFVCHESELRTPGSYMRRSVAGDPIVVVRGHDQVIRGFHNVCRHRGSIVAIEECGRTNTFLCPYHHWSYSVDDGSLRGVPMIEAYDGTGFEKDAFGLVEVRVESMFGFVFACLDDEGPSLAEFIGPDMTAALADPLANVQLEVFLKDTSPFRANWKAFAENGRDGYHVPFVHPFLRKASPPRDYHLYEGFHAIQYVELNKDAVSAEEWAATVQNTLDGLETGQGYVVNIFPDLAFIVRSNLVQVLSQIHVSHDECILENRAFGVVGDTDEQRRSRQATFDTWSARQPPEDIAVMQWQDEGLRSRSVRDSIIARGADATTGRRGDDNRLRQFWSGWRQYLGESHNTYLDLPTA